MILDGIDTLASLEHNGVHRKEQSKDAKLAIGIYLNEWTNGGLDP